MKYCSSCPDYLRSSKRQSRHGRTTVVRTDVLLYDRNRIDKQGPSLFSTQSVDELFMFAARDPVACRHWDVQERSVIT